MKRIVTLSLLALFTGLASAKLPPPPELTDDAKAKAAEAAAKTAHGNKIAAFQLCRAMDRVAARYQADAKKAGKEVKPATAAPCVDPGPLVLVAAAPLEAAGAHSPPATAVAAPSGKATEAQLKGGVKK